MKRDFGLKQGDRYLPEALSGVARNHVASFDYFLDHGLADVVRCLDIIGIQPSEAKNRSSRLKLWVENVSIGRPSKEDTGIVRACDPRVFPRECRESSSTYKAPMSATIAWTFGDVGAISRRNFRIRMFPVMVASKACNLSGFSQEELISRGEEGHEMGGYFILNGIERIIRLLVQQRRHYIM